MKILMFGHKYVPGREGGVEIVVAELAKRMAAEGHEVTLYNRRRRQGNGAPAPTEYEGCRLREVFTVNKRALDAPVYAYFATKRAVKQAKKEHLDVIHVHAEGPCLFLRKFGKPGSKKRAKMPRIVVTIHGLDWQRGKWGGLASAVLRYGEKQAVKYADDIIVLSESNRDYFRRTYGRETIYLPNGVAPATPHAAELITEKWGLGRDGYILFLARIVPEKGLHYLIDAWQSLRARVHTDKKLVIAGGASHSSDYYREIVDKCAGDDSIVMTGFVEGQTLAELYSNAALYVLPSDIEGMPMSLLEAISYGNTCLVSDIPENREVVGDGHLTFRHGDVSDLAAKLEAVLTGEALRDRTASGERKAPATWDEITEKTLRVYRGEPTDGGTATGGAQTNTETESKHEKAVLQLVL